MCIFGMRQGEEIEQKLLVVSLKFVQVNCIFQGSNNITITLVSLDWPVTTWILKGKIVNSYTNVSGFRSFS